MKNTQQYSTSRSRQATFGSLANQAAIIRDLYSKVDLPIHPKSGIGQILSAAESAFNTSVTDLTTAQFWDVLNLERVSKSVLPLTDHFLLKQYLKKLTQGNLNFFKRDQSIAKNSLFELEVWRSLNAIKPKCELGEPDVVLMVDDVKVGFACKKTYSREGVEKVLSKAVKQIERSPCDYGMVAFNFDQLTPEETFVRAESYDQAAGIISEFCRNFLANHAEILQKYFNGSRIVGALAVCSVIVETKVERVPLSNL